MNHWSQVPNADDERHLNHEMVEQSALLSEIIQEKVEQRYPQTVAVYGAGTGNGFVHFVEARTVYAVDPNRSSLAVCHDRYDPILNELVLVPADINHDPVPIPPGSADLIICHLFLEYVDLERAFTSLRQTLRRGGLLNVVLQRSNGRIGRYRTGAPEPTGWVSDTVESIATEISGETLLRYTAPDLRFEGRQTYRMPNGNSLVSYDFVKGGDEQPADEESFDPDGFEWER